MLLLKLKWFSMLDRTDRKILEELQKSGRLKNTDLSESVNLSPTPCLKRVKNLEESGVITGYKAIIDPVKVGLNICSLVLIKLVNNRRQTVDEFTQAVQKIPAITECYLATGKIDYVARVYAKDFPHYEEIIKDDLAELPHLDDMESVFLFSNMVPNGGLNISD